MQYSQTPAKASMVDERLRPYNVRIGGRRTSIRLEQREWQVLCSICEDQGLTVHQFCTLAVQQRTEHSQTSRIRVALLDYCYTGYVKLGGGKPLKAAGQVKPVSGSG